MPTETDFEVKGKADVPGILSPVFLKLCNMNVLQCVYNVDDLDVTPMEHAALESAHYRKIELSDAIYVVDIQGYIGNQVSKEIEFAKSKGKEVIFHSAYRGN